MISNWVDIGLLTFVLFIALLVTYQSGHQSGFQDGMREGRDQERQRQIHNLQSPFKVVLMEADKPDVMGNVTPKDTMADFADKLNRMPKGEFKHGWDRPSDFRSDPNAQQEGK